MVETNNIYSVLLQKPIASVKILRTLPLTNVNIVSDVINNFHQKL